MDRDAEVKKQIHAAIHGINVLGGVSGEKIDLKDPRYAFTLWSVAVAGEGPIFWGRGDTVNNALALAREHVHVKSLVILSAVSQNGLTWVPDEDRVRQGPVPPGSGL